MGRGVDGTQLSLSSCEFLPERRQLGAIYSSLFAFSIHLDSPLAPSTFSHSPCMACLQQPLHVRTLCENPVPRTLNQTVWMQRCPVRFVPIQFDCHCNLVVARLVQRISRLGDKLRIKQIDFIREISPVRCASQLCLLHFAAPMNLPLSCSFYMTSEKHGVRFGCPRWGGPFNIQIRFGPSISIRTSRGCALYHLPSFQSPYGLKSCATRLPICNCTIYRGGHLPQSSYHEYGVTRLGVHSSTSWGAST